jgi:hypothetical protein
MGVDAVEISADADDRNSTEQLLPDDQKHLLGLGDVSYIQYKWAASNLHDAGNALVLTSADSKEASQMAGSSRKTIDHDEIKKWVEDRDGRPARVKTTGDEGDPGLLRINFPGYGKRDTLEDISWEEFFEKFDSKKLAFLYQDTTKSGQESRFFKFVNR